MQREAGLRVHKVEELSDTKVSVQHGALLRRNRPTIVLDEEPPNLTRCRAVEPERKQKSRRVRRKSPVERSHDSVENLGVGDWTSA